jgi:predicted metal-dependent hydrolase
MVSMSDANITIPKSGSINFTHSPRAKYLRITVRPDKSITVTMPKNGNLDEAKKFLQTKLPWIKKQLQKIDQNKQLQSEPDVKNIDLHQTQNDLFKKLDYFSDKYNFPYNKVTFRCQKTRWGSCSGKNNINLNINLAFLPKELQDYVLLHELVHTKIKNHSKDFWSELDKYTDGQAKQRSKALKNYKLKMTG